MECRLRERTDVILDVTVHSKSMGASICMVIFSFRDQIDRWRLHDLVLSAPEVRAASVSVLV